MLHIHRILYLLTKYRYVTGMIPLVFVDFFSHFMAVLGSTDFGMMHWPHICQKRQHVICLCRHRQTRGRAHFKQLQGAGNSSGTCASAMSVIEERKLMV